MRAGGDTGLTQRGQKLIVGFARRLFVHPEQADNQLQGLWLRSANLVLGKLERTDHSLGLGGPLLNRFHQSGQTAAGHFHHRADVQNFVKALLLGAESDRRGEQCRVDIAGLQGNELLDLLSSDGHQNKVLRIYAEFFQRHIESDVDRAAQTRYGNFLGL